MVRARWLGLVAIVVIGAGLLIWRPWQTARHKAAQSEILPGTSSTVKALAHKPGSHPAVHLANSTQPVPTNSWLSGLVFDGSDSVTYLYPWTYKTLKNGAELSYPDVVTSPQTITAGHTPDLKLDFGTDDYQVTAHDDLSAKINYQKSGRTMASLRLVQGSPYVFGTLEPGQQLVVKVSGQFTPHGDGFTIKIGDKHYGVWAGKGATGKSAGGTLTIKAAAHQTGKFSLITLPDGFNEAKAFADAGNAITATRTSYQVDANQVKTTYHLETADHKPTLFGVLPHQSPANTTGRIGSIAILLGRQDFYEGNSFSYTLPAAMPDQKIITTHLTNSQRTTLTHQLAQDIDATKFTATDSYGAGKQLYRAANLLELAHELHQPKAAQAIHDKLLGELKLWLDPHGSRKRANKYFYYDTTIHGIVGVTPSFGSEQFNDHQFHYGYFIYAASVLARYDKDFAREYGDMVAVLIRDIANPSETNDFPRLRTYDTYVGHSWADGYGDTPDGNNQESSSEAVNAAYAIYLWAQATDNNQLKSFGTWLYQNQTASALQYWVQPDKSTQPFRDYQPSIVSLVWQGKLDYGTFFSDAPSAKLGIQLIPMSPGQAYLGGDKQRIKQNLAAIQHPTALADYVIMYQALVDPAAAQKAASRLAAKEIDAADSRTYLDAWIYSHQ